MTTLLGLATGLLLLGACLVVSWLKQRRARKGTRGQVLQFKHPPRRTRRRQHA